METFIRFNENSEEFYLSTEDIYCLDEYGNLINDSNGQDTGFCIGDFDDYENGIFDTYYNVTFKKIAISLSTKENKEEKEDIIYEPKHYKAPNGIEVLEVQEGFIGDLKGMSASYWCNVVKYMLRFQNKNGVEDLEKAYNYLKMLIKEQKKKPL